jgi:hypothetical protein
VGLSDAERAQSRRWLDGVAKELGAYFWDERLAARLERVPGTGGGNSLGAHSIRGEVQVDINEYLGGDHLRREDVPKPILVTVTEVTVKEFDNPPERKAVLHFAETERSLVANKTNLKIAKSVFGTSETNDWKGKKIVVYGGVLKEELVDMLERLTNKVRLGFFVDVAADGRAENDRLPGRTLRICATRE